MKNTVRALGLAALLGFGAQGVGCHANENDAAGQAKELSDPVRRQYALTNITRLFQVAMERAHGNRDDASVKAIIDATQEQLTQTYLNSPEDQASRKVIIDLFREMRDVRTLPAILKALEWRTEVSEDQAIAAAQALAKMTLNETQKTQAASAIAAALDKVTGGRQADNRMRVEFLRALGDLGVASAAESIAKVATMRSDVPNFFQMNRMAYEELVRVATPATMNAFVRALMFCDGRNPAMRVNDLASLGLVTLGRDSIPVLQQVIAGQNEVANAALNEYMAVARAKDPMIAARINPQTELVTQALAVLGDIGDRSSFQTLLNEARSEDEVRRRSAAIALIRIHRNAEETPVVRDAIKAVYERADKPTRAQLSAGLARFLDPQMQSFFYDRARAPEEELPDIRVLSFIAFSYLANAAEASQARELIAREPGPDEGGFKTNFMELDAALQTATECNEDVACYVRKLNDGNKTVVRKAVFMIARYGRGNAEAMSALIEKINHREREVREDVLYAIDFLSDGANQAAIDKIEATRRAEAGQSSWEHMKVLALTTAGRLRMRASN